MSNNKIVIQSEEEALEIYNELARAESAVKQMKEALKDYVKKNGEVANKKTDVRMQLASRKPVWTFNDMSKVYNLLYFDQLNPNDYFNITGSKAEKLAKIWSEEEMKLAGGKLKERSDQFKITKY